MERNNYTRNENDNKFMYQTGTNLFVEFAFKFIYYYFDYRIIEFIKIVFLIPYFYLINVLAYIYKKNTRDRIVHVRIIPEIRFCQVRVNQVSL